MIGGSDVYVVCILWGKFDYMEWRRCFDVCTTALIQQDKSAHTS